MTALLPRRERYIAWILTVFLHGLALWGLWQIDSVREAVHAAAPIFVQFITPPQALPQSPRPVPPEQKRVQPPPAPQRMIAPANPTPSPAPAMVAPAPPVPPAVSSATEASMVLAPPSYSAAYLNNPKPTYPALSRRLREEGKVLLQVVVSADGTVERLSVQRSSGSERLDQAALAAVRDWRFIPARQAGKPVAAPVLVPIVFSLQEG